MKTMKRFIAAVMAVTSVMALAPMSAFADTTDVTFDAPPISPAYTITIPASVDLNAETPTATIKAEDVYLDTTKHKQINVTLDSAQYVETGASEFIAKTEDGSSSVTYTIGKGTAKTGVKVGDTVAEFTTDGSVTLNFSEPTGATYAGTHTETLTFGVSVETTKAAAETPAIAQADCTFSPANGTSTLSNTNITTSMEYSTDSGTTWTDVTSAGSIASLAAGTVQIRVKETSDKLASEAVSITVPQVLKINELVGPYTGDKLTCEYYAGETWQALVDRYDLIKVYSGRAAFGSDGFIYYESGSAVPVTDLVDNTKTYEVQ